MSKAECDVSSNAAILGGSAALSQPYSWIPPYTHGKGNPQGSNLNPRNLYRRRRCPRKRPSNLPQVKTSNLKHVSSTKYLISLKVINIYWVL